MTGRRIHIFVGIRQTILYKGVKRNSPFAFVLTDRENYGRIWIRFIIWKINLEDYDDIR